MEPADRAGLHWQPLAASEPERLFDQVAAPEAWGRQWGASTRDVGQPTDTEQEGA